MPDVSEHTWLKQIEQGEHTQQEFKFRIDSSREIAQTLCAFANTEGGILWVGVKDNGKISGCNPEEEFHMIFGAARLYCFPEVKINASVLILHGKQVLKCEVPFSDLRPHFARLDEKKKLAFIRGTELEFVIMVIAVSCVKLLSAHNSTQHTSRKHKV
jgi:Predicted transcriptional regulator containing an HTH domain and an uncharacterized domain shared with the mammalian protein Schlafen